MAGSVVNTPVIGLTDVMLPGGVAPYMSAIVRVILCSVQVELFVVARTIGPEMIVGI